MIVGVKIVIFDRISLISLRILPKFESWKQKDPHHEM